MCLSCSLSIVTQEWSGTECVKTLSPVSTNSGTVGTIMLPCHLGHAFPQGLSHFPHLAELYLLYCMKTDKLASHSRASFLSKYSKTL